MDRRIAAILASDMVGFSRLIEIDEEGILARQKRYRLELIEPSISNFNGNIIKFTGDGIIAEFASVVEAVQCAVHLQNEIAERELTQDASLRIQYRMAVNLGDVIFDDGDVFGDGVNVAARLESVAPAGGVVVSGAAYDLLKNQVRVQYQPLGKKKLKNIAKPVRVYSVLPTRSTAHKPRWGVKYGLTRKRTLVVIAAFSVLIGVASGVSFLRPKHSFDERLNQMIYAAQQNLEANNYLSEFEPGKIGASTRTALADYQLDNGIAETGILGAETASALGVPIRLFESDWDSVQAGRQKARLRQPEIFEHLSADQRLLHASRVLEGSEFSYGFFQNRLYIAIAPRTVVPWMESILVAKRIGGYLTTIGSKEENEFVFDLISKDPKFWRLSKDKDFWIGPGIGLYQEEGSIEPNLGWKWLSGEDVSYTNWMRSQPNNWGGVNERVATFYSLARNVREDEEPTYGSTWNDETPWFYSYVIEIE